MTLSGETFEAYLTYLYECALHRYGDCPEIDTIVQESMLAFWKTLQSGAEIAHPKGFLATVLQRKYNDYLRSKYKNSVVIYGIPETVVMPEEENENNSDEYEAVRREIGQLVAIYREVTVRHYVHGHSVDKIAQDLGIPRGTVLSRLSKAREQVKEGLDMEKYAQVSYEPKKVGIGIWGGTGLGHEPFSLLSSPIEGNILHLAYEKPISIREIAGALGMPCAYLEPLVDRLVKGELMGKTPAGLVYTRAYMVHYKDSFGNISAQEALADKMAEPVWQIIWKHLSPLTEQPTFRSMTPKQQATLLLFLIRQSLSKLSVRLNSLPTDLSSLPERPNAGRWLATLTVKDQADNTHITKYEGSGPVHVQYSSENGTRKCEMYDAQTVFGDAHWAYNGFKYRYPLGNIMRFYASFTPSGITPENHLINELVPEFEKLHILCRDENDRICLDIPALTYEEMQPWQQAEQAMQQELFVLLEKELQSILQSGARRIPKHVDGALNAYPTAQLLSILEKGLFPLPVALGQTPLILLIYRQKED